MTTRRAETYRHREQAVLRPEVGTQAQFKKRKSATKYRYDDSLSPALEWDGQNPARDIGEWLIQLIEQASKLPSPHKFPEPRRLGNIVIHGLEDAIAQLKRLERPFL